MRPSYTKWFIIGIVILILIFASVFMVLKNISKPIIIPVVETISSAPKSEIIGKSVEGRDITSYIYGNGERNLVFVGGIHGGYEWNSVLLAYKFMDYLEANPTSIPKNLNITVIPSMNPDGVYKVTGKDGRFTVLDVKDDLPNGTGRFNANNVDLNRNFDCKWQATSTWKTNIVSAGTAVFSEPEAKAIQNFVIKNNPTAVIFWHSMSNTIYGSACGGDILPVTRDLMTTYSQASSYKVADTFSAYTITGDVSDWLASIKIPSITVELATHESIEWDKNLAGIKALFTYFANK
jgi:hypothetical protein